ETDNGGGYPRRTDSAEQYVAYANATIKAMRSVDPTVKIGIISATGKPVSDPWNGIVFRQAAKNADFVVVHNYAVGQDTTSPEDLVMRGCMASDDQFAADFQAYHAAIRKALGHDLPIALTEYNGGFDAPTPPYRFSFGAALFCADLIRVLLQPENNILLANYWQGLNGYWGMLRGEGDTWMTMPAYPLRRLWGQHFGKTLLQCSIQGPTADFEGVQLVKPARGTRYIPEKQIAGNLLDLTKLRPSDLSAFGASVTGGVLSYDLHGTTINQFPLLAAIPMPESLSGNGAVFTLSYDIRATPTGAGQGNLSLGMMDSRGWEATHSAAKIGGAAVDGQWHHYSGVYGSRPDTQTADVVVRVEDPNPVINAHVEVKNLTVTASTSEIFPAYALVTASASSSADGKTIYLVAFNKSTQQDIPIDVHIQGVPLLGARRWAVTGPSLGTTNLDAENIKETETNVVTPISGGILSPVLPARSMTVFEIQTKGQHS
ncbi:MAG: GH39 family glycosyl hydrolase, partial [Janthinobacterium lividum]